MWTFVLDSVHLELLRRGASIRDFVRAIRLLSPALVNTSSEE